MDGARSCDDNRLFIEQYADHELSYADSAAMAAHLTACPVCRARFEELKRLKAEMRAADRDERLSSDERLAIENLVTRTAAAHRSLLKGFRAHIPRPAALLAGAALATVVTIALLYDRLATADRDGDLLVSEIMQVHESQLPDEFGTADDIESVVRANLDLPRARIPRFVKDQPILKARFSHIGRLPAASVHIADGHGAGTLMVTHRNDDLKKMFSDGACVPELTCRAHRISRRGKDLVYWEDTGGDYLFVSDDRRMTDHFVHLIGDEVR